MTPAIGQTAWCASPHPAAQCGTIRPPVYDPANLPTDWAARPDWELRGVCRAYFLQHRPAIDDEEKERCGRVRECFWPARGKAGMTLCELEAALDRRKSFDLRPVNICDFRQRPGRRGSTAASLYVRLTAGA